MIKIYYDNGNVVAVLSSNPHYVIGFLNNQQRQNLLESMKSCVIAIGWKLNDVILECK